MLKMTFWESDAKRENRNMEIKIECESEHDGYNGTRDILIVKPDKNENNIQIKINDNDMIVVNTRTLLNAIKAISE